MRGVPTTLAEERAQDEFTGPQASAWLTARVNQRQRFTVTILGQPYIVGGTLVQDVQFDSGDRVTLRIATARAYQLVNAWGRVLRQER